MPKNIGFERNCYTIVYDPHNTTLGTGELNVLMEPYIAKIIEVPIQTPVAAGINFSKGFKFQRNGELLPIPTQYTDKIKIDRKMQ